MNPRTPIRHLATALVLALASCRSVTVEPAAARPPALPASQRRPLDFELHVTDDPRLFSADLDESSTVVLDGEDIARLVPSFRGALEATTAFSTVTRARAGKRLHCDLSVRKCRAVWGGGFLLALSLGLLPDVEHQYYEIVARVSAPGRSPQTYTVRSHGQTFLWMPLVPVALVQLLVTSGTLQQTVDSLVAQIAADGWLEP
jgi:hypothetical protein